MNKKLISLAVALAISSSVFAGTKLNVVNPASADGGTRQVLAAVSDGFETELTQAGNPVNASSMLATTNTLTVWSSEWPGNAKIKSPAVTSDNTIGVILYETAMCSREFTSLAEMRGKTVKIATWGHVHASKFLKTFGAQHNVNFTIVPYSGSGAIAMGYIGGDANTTFLTESKASTVNKDGKTTCFVSSLKNQIDFRFVDAIIALNTDATVTNELRASLAKQSASASWKEKLYGTRTFVGGGVDNLKYYFDSVKHLTDIAAN